MSNSDDGRKSYYLFRHGEDVPVSPPKESASSEPMKLIDSLLRSSDSSDGFGGADAQTMARLLTVVQQWGHLDFCVDPVCEQLVAAILSPDADGGRSSVSTGVIRIVAATLNQDLTARSRLSAFWGKLKRTVV